LAINGNDSLKSLHGLESLTKIDSTLLIDGNESLYDLSGLDNIASIGGNFEVNHGGDFTEIHGMESLISVGGNFLIGWNSNAIFHGNPQLSNLNGLENLSTVGGDLVIASSDSLNNLIGLENLNYIGGNLRIGGHPALENLTGLDNLISIGGSLRIANNSLLTDITSLNDLDANSITNLTIEDNNSLSSCELESICEYLVTPNGTVEIHDNAAGCNSQEEVEEICTFYVNESSIINNLGIYPNPASQELNLSIEQFTIDEVVIYTLTGQSVLAIRPKREAIDISTLQPGMYIVEVMVEGRKVRRKLVIE
jgi:hypothetical protein